MSTSTHSQPPAGLAVRHAPAGVLGLAGLLAILAVGALQGGIAMVTDPLSPLGMPTSFLDRTPIDTYTWPGVFLLAIAAASLVTAGGLVSGWKWRWAASIEASLGHRWPWVGAVATGTIVLAFEIIELIAVPLHPVMHPLLIAWSTAIVGLALSPSVRRHLRIVGSGGSGRGAVDGDGRSVDERGP